MDQATADAVKSYQSRTPEGRRHRRPADVGQARGARFSSLASTCSSRGAKSFLHRSDGFSGTPASGQALKDKALAMHGPAFMEKLNRSRSAGREARADAEGHETTESGLKPGIQNSIGATGLIQFMPQTAARAGHHHRCARSDERGRPARLRPRSSTKSHAGKMHSTADLYSATFWPAMIGKPDDYVLETSKLSAGIVARQKRGLRHRPRRQRSPPESSALTAAAASATTPIPLSRRTFNGAATPSSAMRELSRPPLFSAVARFRAERFRKSAVACAPRWSASESSSSFAAWAPGAWARCISPARPTSVRWW